MDKHEIRRRVWDSLDESGDARFPFPPHDRIPNFAGADDARDRLTETDEWEAADVIKSNPDAPQLPVRRAALRAGKTIYVAVPRLRDEKCFLRLDPAEIDDYDHATTIGGSSEVGVHVGPDEMDDIDFIVSGSVAVSETGARIGKGEGYSDLEFAILSEFGRVDETTTVATTVHELQVLEESVPTAPHDVPLDLIATPRRTIRPESRLETPGGIRWDALTEEQVEAMPILGQLRE